jgi:heavy metal translocating P-type ATPase
MKKTYRISGMTCAACAQTIQNIANSHAQNAKVSVNFAMERLHLDGQYLEEDLFQKISVAGYKLHSLDSSDAQEELKANKKLFALVVFGLVSAAILFLLAMVFHRHLEQSLNFKLQAIVATLLLVIVGHPFVLAVPRFFRFGHGNMNTLVGFGVLAAWFYSMAVTFLPNFMQQHGFEQVVYFEAMGFIMAFVHLGKWLELKAKQRAKQGLEGLLQIAAKSAIVWREKSWSEVAIEHIALGDFVRVTVGEKIPVDGEIVKGESLIDESMLSGEPLGVHKKIGEQVHAGTINLEGVLEIKATGVGAETLLAQIVRAVNDAQVAKAPIQKLADRVSGFFVPIVLVIAVSTILFWGVILEQWVQGLSAMIAVLVIACPCALGLATPLAMVISSTLAVKRGLLIAGADVIEKGQEIDTIVFDKTGTLTLGKPTLVHAIWNDLAFKHKVAALASLSTHPLSQIIAKEIQKENNTNFEQVCDDLESFDVVPGLGIKGKFGQDDIVLGSANLMLKYGLSKEHLEQFEDHGLTRSFALANQKIVAIFDLDDEVKKEAPEVIKSLKNLGKKIVMLTGDREQSAQRIAAKIGVDQIFSQTMPTQKEEVIKELQKNGRRLLMVGDGLNDAAALSRADLSMAMGTGTDVAMQASDVTIVKGRLGAVVDFFTIAQKTMKVAKQNLALSFVYNFLCIPLAASGNFPPMLAGIAMGLSSLSVVANSWRLRRAIF